MYNDICPICNRANQVWRGKSIVNYKWNPVAVRHFCNCFNICNIRIGVSQCFNKDRFCIFLDCSFYCLRLRFRKCRRNPIFGQRMRQQIICASIDIFCSNNMIAVLRQILECIGKRCSAGRYC